MSESSDLGLGETESGPPNKKDMWGEIQTFEVQEEVFKEMGERL